MMVEVWEGVAADVLDETGLDAPMSALELAQCCGFEVRLRPIARARLMGRVIEVAAGARSTRQHGLVAHELGHWALRRAGEEDTEGGARYLSGALMLPRRAFSRDLGETGWSIEQLRARHPNASAEMIARRIVSLRDAVASIWDAGRCTARVASPWIEERRVGRRVSSAERDLAARVFDSGEVQHPAERVWAVPVFEALHRRVVVVMEAEQLAIRW